MNEQTLQNLMNTISVLEKKVQSLQDTVKRLDQSGRAQYGVQKYEALEVNDLVINGTIRMGQGDIAMHADFQGWWWGKERLATIVGGAKGVAILHNGTFYQNP